MKKYRHTQFQKGWWSCFIAFCEITECYASPGDNTIKQMLESAGVTKEELNYVINSEKMPEDIQKILSCFLKYMSDKGEL